MASLPFYFGRRSGSESSYMDSNGNMIKVAPGERQRIITSAEVNTYGRMRERGMLDENGEFNENLVKNGSVSNILNTILKTILQPLIDNKDTIADIFDTISGNKLAYERAQEQTALANQWNSEEAQMARAIAAGLNPYMNDLAGSSTASSADVPGSNGLADSLMVNPLDMISGLFNAFKALPENIIQDISGIEDIRGKRIKNIDDALSIGLNRDKAEAEINHLFNEDRLERERRNQEKEEFEHQKNIIWKQQQERHEKEMRALDDQNLKFKDEHEKEVYLRTRRPVQEILDDLLIRTQENTANQQEWQYNYMNRLQEAYLVAQTNHFINQDVATLRELGLKQLDLEQRLRIGEFQEKLLDGQLTAQEYTNALIPYGLTLQSDPEDIAEALEGKPKWRVHFNKVARMFSTDALGKLNLVFGKVGNSPSLPASPVQSGIPPVPYN